MLCTFTHTHVKLRIRFDHFLLPNKANIFHSTKRKKKNKQLKKTDNALRANATPYPISDVTLVLFVMSHELCPALHFLLVDCVLPEVVRSHNHGLLHLVGKNQGDDGLHDSSSSSSSLPLFPASVFLYLRV